ncbi:hypothetical protein [Roseateles sp. PN1]|uniref:hypothetical protein n=1 Tax=Roseateles sp. PN1 TaxID=3137372 RepID=UPI00313944C5
MNKKQQDFISDYQKALDQEFSHFNAEAAKHHAEGEKLTPAQFKSLDEKVKEEDKSLQFTKEKLASYDLSVKEAKEILAHKSPSEFFGVDDINGADCYRFMSFSLRNNKEVALAAVQADPKMSRHLTRGLQERVQGKSPEQTLKSDLVMEQIQTKMAQSRKPSMSMGMSL